MVRFHDRLSAMMQIQREIKMFKPNLDDFFSIETCKLSEDSMFIHSFVTSYVTHYLGDSMTYGCFFGVLNRMPKGRLQYIGSNRWSGGEVIQMEFSDEETLQGLATILKILGAEMTWETHEGESCVKSPREGYIRGDKATLYIKFQD